MKSGNEGDVSGEAVAVETGISNHASSYASVVGTPGSCAVQFSAMGKVGGVGVERGVVVGVKIGVGANSHVNANIRGYANIRIDAQLSGELGCQSNWIDDKLNSWMMLIGTDRLDMVIVVVKVWNIAVDIRLTALDTENDVILIFHGG